MNLQPITALSPLDGRYESKVSALREHFSEFGLIRNRIKVEIEWLKALAAAPELAEIAPFSAATVAELDAVIADFSVADGEAVKAIEATTNHDVKAMEYWLKKRLGHNAEVTRVTEFIHFGCTSEDINNVSHALMLRDGRDGVLLPALDKIIARLVELAHQLADLPMAVRGAMDHRQWALSLRGFERIRDELRLGKTPRAAVDAGFDRAFSSIFDGQVTTLIVGVVLYQFGTGPIKGFAVMLMLGIVTSLFTGIFCSRVALDWIVRGLKVERLRVG